MPLCYIYEAMSNLTIITDFQLLGFSKDRADQILHFVLFLAMYLIVLLGNILIIILVVLNPHLQTPMYFFLVNLSAVELGLTSVTIPKFMTNALMNTTQITFSGCFAQMLFFIFFLSSDIFLLTVMAYDRYVAICNPLHYVSVMNWGSCTRMASGAWIAGFMNGAVHAGTVFSLPFCSNTINQFFCEIPQLIKLLCSDSFFSEPWPLLFSISIGFGCFVFIIISYVQIFTTVLRMPSLEKRQKAFSTCIPHLTVVSLFVSTSVFAHLVPTPNSSYNLHQLLAVMYSVVPPMMNPIIYSMRNKDVKSALWKLVCWKYPSNSKMFHFHP